MLKKREKKKVKASQREKLSISACDPTAYDKKEGALQIKCAHGDDKCFWVHDLGNVIRGKSNIYHHDEAKEISTCMYCFYYKREKEAIQEARVGIYI